MLKSILLSAALLTGFVTTAHAEDPVPGQTTICEANAIVYYAETPRNQNLFVLVCKAQGGVNVMYGQADGRHVQSNQYYPDNVIQPIIGHSTSDASSVLSIMVQGTGMKIGHTFRPDYEIDLNAVVVYQQNKMVGKYFFAKRTVIDNIREFYDDSY